MSERIYKVIAISMYLKDIEAMDATVARLRASGVDATRSAVIRAALQKVDDRDLAKFVAAEAKERIIRRRPYRPSPQASKDHGQ